MNEPTAEEPTQEETAVLLSVMRQPMTGAVQCLRAHVASELAPLQRINKRASEEWSEDHTAIEKLCVECGVRFDENEDMKSISELVEVLRKAVMRERDQLRADLATTREARKSTP